MSHRLGVPLLSLSLACFPLACGRAPVAPTPAAGETPAAAAVTSASAAPAEVASPPSASSAAPASSSASCADKQIRDSQGNCVAAPCPSGQPPGADGSCAESPPCVDGQVLMGACICSGGKGVDATGHCVFMPCAKGNQGGTVFRSPATGQCMECRPGTVPCGDGCCPAGGRSR